MKDEGIINLYITKAKDEHTAIANQDLKDARSITIDTAQAANNQAKVKPQLLQQGKNIGYVLAIPVQKLVHRFTKQQSTSKIQTQANRGALPQKVRAHHDHL